MDKASIQYACIPAQYLGTGAVETANCVQADKFKRRLHRDSMHHADYYGRHVNCYMMTCLFAMYASLSDATWVSYVQVGVLLIVLVHAACGALHGFAQKRAAYQWEQCRVMNSGQKSKTL
ncbi:hypothetical protein SDRG_03906 [Saprolegnia diclina VS20]|uniref:Uncharacterized protein n=1 Tax=Saprolegnia diclina (strain VS20) TaxID=1156394 RepID=T0QWC2_SAPDV|nr:hypothetical protein SDRG_03906 [Saprolegnia diclina VS20]EQC38951.1 hypothetical protein SDRG_03906 [Saprolegnia diclina VS20]|eukprot:XP_008607775.1 hypothetical protein SDRG_03906 [Saprolegnia diclina VS20]